MAALLVLMPVSSCAAPAAGGAGTVVQIDTTTSTHTVNPMFMGCHSDSGFAHTVRLRGIAGWRRRRPIHQCHCPAVAPHLAAIGEVWPWPDADTAAPPRGPPAPAPAGAWFLQPDDLRRELRIRQRILVGLRATAVGHVPIRRYASHAQARSSWPSLPRFSPLLQRVDGHQTCHPEPRRLARRTHGWHL